MRLPWANPETRANTRFAPTVNMFTKPFNQLSKHDAAVAGGKGASLGEMTRAGIPVPPGFVVVADAFEHFLEETDLNVEIEAILKKVDHQNVYTVERASEKIQAMIEGAKMPEDIELAIHKAFSSLRGSAKQSPLGPFGDCRAPSDFARNDSTKIGSDPNSGPDPISFFLSSSRKWGSRFLSSQE